MNWNLLSDENAVALIYLYSIPFHIVIILFELFYSYYNKKKWYKFSDTLTNVYMALLNFAMDIALKAFAMWVMFLFYEHKIFELNWRTPLYWLGVFVLQDFAYYLLHCLDHRSRLFWAIHVTHHNSEYFNVTTGFRSSVFQPLYRYLFFAPIALLGVNPWHIMSMYALVQIYGTWIHTKSVKNMGILEYILVTPSHHRVHHASNHRYLDRNMGMGLIIWDKIFGTFEKEDSHYEEIQFGLTSPLDDKGPVNIVLHELKAIYKDATQKNISLADRFKYIFYPPGWSHTGDYKTSAVLRAEEKASRKS